MHLERQGDRVIQGVRIVLVWIATLCLFSLSYFLASGIVLRSAVCLLGGLAWGKIFSPYLVSKPWWFRGLLLAVTLYFVLLLSIGLHSRGLYFPLGPHTLIWLWRHPETQFLKSFPYEVLLFLGGAARSAYAFYGFHLGPPDSHATTALADDSAPSWVWNGLAVVLASSIGLFLVQSNRFFQLKKQVAWTEAYVRGLRAQENGDLSGSKASFETALKASRVLGGTIRLEKTLLALARWELSQGNNLALAQDHVARSLLLTGERLGSASDAMRHSWKLKIQIDQALEDGPAWEASAGSYLSFTKAGTEPGFWAEIELAKAHFFRGKTEEAIERLDRLLEAKNLPAALRGLSLAIVIQALAALKRSDEIRPRLDQLEAWKKEHPARPKERPLSFDLAAFDGHFMQDAPRLPALKNWHARLQSRDKDCSTKSCHAAIRKRFYDWLWLQGDLDSLRKELETRYRAYANTAYSLPYALELVEFLSEFGPLKRAQSIAQLASRTIHENPNTAYLKRALLEGYQSRIARHLGDMQAAQEHLEASQSWWRRLLRARDAATRTRVQEAWLEGPKDFFPTNQSLHAVELQEIYATHLYQTGNLQAAQRGAEQVHARWLRRFGPDHPRRIPILGLLASLAARRGDFRKTQEFRDLRKERIQAFYDPTHPLLQEI